MASLNRAFSVQVLTKRWVPHIWRSLIAPDMGHLNPPRATPTTPQAPCPIHFTSFVKWVGDHEPASNPFADLLNRFAPRHPYAKCMKSCQIAPNNDVLSPFCVVFGDFQPDFLCLFDALQAHDLAQWLSIRPFVLMRRDRISS
jgi:hypothetical protein